MIRDIQKVDNDICEAKRKIKEVLYSDPDIIEILHNPKLDPEVPDEYLNKNIFGYIRIPDTITDVMNYICFDISQKRISEANSIMKEQYYMFYVYSHEDDISTPYGLERHDLLAYLIIDLFNYSNMFGTQLQLVSNIPGVMDSHYSSRCLTFKAVDTNSINRGVTTNRYEFRNR